MLKKLTFVLCFVTLLTVVGCQTQTATPKTTEPKENTSQQKQNNTTDNNDQAKQKEAQEKLLAEIAKINYEDYQLKPPAKGDTIAVMKTSLGDIKIKFFPKEAPKAVENFTKLSQKGYYNGLNFHRVMKDFMIQGGDPLGTGTGGESIWGKPFEDEFSFNLRNFRGALSMANSGENTNGSQFFIVQVKNLPEDTKLSLQNGGAPQNIINQYSKTGGTPWLDNKHTVFGQVFEGMDVVDKIANVKVGTNDKPVKDVKIDKVEITIY